MALEQERREQIGARLLALRKDRHLTQSAVADAVGVTLRALQSWEHGDSGIKWANVEALAKFFRVDPDLLLSGDREAPAQSPLEAFSAQDQIARLEAKIDALTEQVQAQTQTLLLLAGGGVDALTPEEAARDRLAQALRDQSQQQRERQSGEPDTKPASLRRRRRAQ